MKYEEIKKASILGMLGNIFLLIIKAIIAFFSHSQAMMADAFNSAGDIFSSIMTFIGNKISSIPRDDDHDLGHGKAEYIYSLLISIVMALMAFKVFKSSFLSLIKQDTFIFSYYLVGVCLITIVVKFLLFIYTNRLYKRHKNILLKANSKDHINDCFITLINLIACLGSLIGIYFIDGVVGIGIGIYIFITACKIFIESYDVLMDKSISKETRSKVLDIVKKHEEIVKTNHFNATPVGYQYQISLTIFVDGNMSTFESHEIANRLEKEIDEEIPEIYLTVIHVNPMNVDNK